MLIRTDNESRQGGSMKNLIRIIKEELTAEINYQEYEAWESGQVAL